MKTASRTSSPSRDVVSPFAGVEAAIPEMRRRKPKLFLWTGLVIALLAIASVATVLVSKFLKDPYRTLEPFPVAKYLESHRALAGLRFKAEVRVEADLGWKPDTGRLMLFSVSNEPRPIAVLVPAHVAKDAYFTKGQVYMAELEVKEGGLIYANSCRKN